MKRVDVLKEGLSKLHNQIWDRKTKLEIELKAGQIISEADQDWLDGDGNLVDDERVVEALDNASDYEQGLEGLNSQDKLIVEKLQKLAGKGGIPSNKHGSKKLPPLIIGKYQKPRPFKNRTGTQLGFNYHNNAKAWMTSAIYQEWLLDWDRKLKNEGQKFLLLQDNFSGHVVPETPTNIRGIIHCFKAKCCAQFIQQAIDFYDTGVTPSRIYNIHQPDVMQLARSVWEEVDTMMTLNCWRKASILPTINSSAPTNLSVPVSMLIHADGLLQVDLDPIVQAEKDVIMALDNLEATGALQHSNRMDIEELLNPTEERQDLFEVTDQDIYNTVMEAKAAREKTAVAGGSDKLDDSDEPVKPTRTRKEALQAALILEEYINKVY
ncbi:hypothetical protein PAXRUDRAFT_19714 [Paxillus rubicundulus Ve08.2h10]|uniref:DDE-1 domain-containing protein n=1 Tax=Paxillus rubicundulus Ve08.2h10 TaxID=930991 RepID=A0A0D0CU32_9AGAM|nr:hypothetical protein PAXRUDRAFT_19714 [Paxillus rubicundulus Ve08.2h10]